MSTLEKGNGMRCGADMKVEEMESMVYLSITKRTENLTHLPPNSSRLPEDSYRVTRDLSGGDKLRNGFLGQS
jgi:hypothetical protein